MCLEIQWVWADESNYIFISNFKILIYLLFHEKSSAAFFSIEIIMSWTQNSVYVCNFANTKKKASLHTLTSQPSPKIMIFFCYCKRILTCSMDDVHCRQLGYSTVKHFEQSVSSCSEEASSSPCSSIFLLNNNQCFHPRYFFSILH